MMNRQALDLIARMDEPAQYTRMQGRRVFPARAWMNRQSHLLNSFRLSIPRARMDEPARLRVWTELPTDFL
jgi:hypothetical protein